MRSWYLEFVGLWFLVHYVQGNVESNAFPRFYNNVDEWQLTNWDYPTNIANPACVTIWTNIPSVSYDDGNRGEGDSTLLVKSSNKFDMKWICLGGINVTSNNQSTDNAIDSVYQLSLWFDLNANDDVVFQNNR